MQLPALHKRVIGLDVHHAQDTTCAIIEESEGAMRIEQRQLGAIKRHRLRDSLYFFGLLAGAGRGNLKKA